MKIAQSILFCILLSSFIIGLFHLNTKGSVLFAWTIWGLTMLAALDAEQKEKRESVIVYYIILLSSAIYFFFIK